MANHRVAAVNTATRPRLSLPESFQGVGDLRDKRPNPQAAGDRSPHDATKKASPPVAPRRVAPRARELVQDRRASWTERAHQPPSRQRRSATTSHRRCAADAGTPAGVLTSLTLSASRSAVAAATGRRGRARVVAVAPPALPLRRRQSPGSRDCCRGCRTCLASEVRRA